MSWLSNLIDNMAHIGSDEECSWCCPECGNEYYDHEECDKNHVRCLACGAMYIPSDTIGV